MGDNFGDGESRERPVHTVYVDAFYIGKYEVTNAQWRAFRDDPAYPESVLPKDQVPYWNDAKNHGGGTPDSDNYPVLGINWDGATAYCKWLSAKTGQNYRLPTEAEWKRPRAVPTSAAIRGQPDRPLLRELHRFQAFRHRRSCRHYPKGASPYGAMDMAGNVMECVPGLVRARLLFRSPKKNPKGPETGAYRVLRGGTFFEDGFDLRSYARTAAWPSVQSHRMIGFRVARSL